MYLTRFPNKLFGAPLLVVFIAFLDVDLALSAEESEDNYVRKCGQLYAGPFGRAEYAVERPCVEPAARSYESKYVGIAKTALDIQSEACFVPDTSYRLLDGIVDGVHAKVRAKNIDPQHNRRTFAEQLSALTGDELAERGFGLYIPTKTLADALHHRKTDFETPQRNIDCDVSSLILLEVAESYGLSASLVDITLRSGAGHNYVRWQVDSDAFSIGILMGVRSVKLRRICQHPRASACRAKKPRVT